MASFTASRITRTATMRLVAPPSDVFPLLEPIGEKQWAAGWEPEMLYPPTGLAEEGAVFLIGHSAEESSIWTIVRYNPAAFQIAYLRVTPGSDSARIEIACADNRDGTTRTDVTYIFTALTERGNAALEKYTEAYFREWIASWETAINHYLRHGSLLQHHAAG
jgi:hypothetical protein